MSLPVQPVTAMAEQRTALVVDVDEGLLESASATFDQDRIYRYALTRTWDTDRPVATFIMLNPSTADAFKLDPTIRRCIGFARAWGCGGLVVVNLFGLRSTDPKGLYTHPDPVGVANDEVIADQLAAAAGPVVAAWGAHGVHLNRCGQVGALVQQCGRSLLCLGVTNAGQPRHPLYVPGARPAVDYSVTASAGHRSG